MAQFRVIIAGCREFNDYSLLQQKCDNILSSVRQTHTVVIVSGTARGADQLGERYAAERGYQVRRFPADWERDGKAAGPIRNALMADNADALIAFWDGLSRGTKNMIDTAKNRGLPVRVIDIYKIINMTNEEKNIKNKWGELLQYAKEHATGEGFHRGYTWLKDSFDEYLELSDATPGYGMGGQPGSQHNREVLAGRILLKLGNHIGGDHTISDEQEAQLKESLASIVHGQAQTLKL